MRVSQKLNGVLMEKPLAHFYVKTEISEDFHIRISVPLMKERKQPPVVILQQAIL